MMESTNEREVWVGLDWGDKEHAVALLTPATGQVARFTVPHTAAGMAQLRERLAAAGVVRGVAIERPRHLVVDELLAAGYTVYPINPKVAKAWREGTGVQASKTDARDAAMLAWGLFQRRAELRALAPDDPQTAELLGLCRDEMKLIDQRTEVAGRVEGLLSRGAGVVRRLDPADGVGFYHDVSRPGGAAGGEPEKTVRVLQNPRFGPAAVLAGQNRRAGRRAGLVRQRRHGAGGIVLRPGAGPPTPRVADRARRLPEAHRCVVPSASRRGHFRLAARGR